MWFIPRKGGANLCGSCLYLVSNGQRYGFPRNGNPFQQAKNAGFVVHLQRTHPSGAVEGTPQFARFPTDPLSNTGDGHSHNFAAGKGHQFAGIHVADGVSKPSISHGSGIVVGHGANACGAVPHPDSSFIAAVIRGFHRLQADLHPGVFAAEFHSDCFPLGTGDRGCNIFIGGDLPPANREDDIPGGDARLFRRVDRLAVQIDVGKAHHHHPLGEHLQPERISPWDYIVALHHLDVDLFDADGAKHFQVQVVAVPRLIVCVGRQPFCRLHGGDIPPGPDGKGFPFHHIKIIGQGHLHI